MLIIENIRYVLCTRLAAVCVEEFIHLTLVWAVRSSPTTGC